MQLGHRSKLLGHATDKPGGAGTPQSLGASGGLGTAATLAGRLRCDPLILASRDALTQQTPAGDVIKFQAQHDTRFWRGNDLSSEAFSLDRSVALTYDNCVPDSDTVIFVGFVEGHHAKVFNELSEEERQRRILADLVDMLGPYAAEPIDFLQRNWKGDPFSAAATAAGWASACGPTWASTCASSSDTSAGWVQRR